MKKLITMCAVAALCAASLSSCGSDSVNYNYNFADYLTLGSYTGIEVSKAAIQTEIDSQYDTILAQNTYDVETEAASVDGNKVIYSMTATVDGAAVDALAKTDATFTVGSSTTDYEELTAIFEGISADDTKEITVTLPDDYSDAALAGKEATLNVTVSSVTTAVTPTEVTDEMVKSATSEQYTTVADYDVYLYDTIKQNMVWDKVVNNTTFIKYPKKEAEIYYNNYLASYQSTAAQYGMALDQLISLYGMTTDAFYKNIANQAIAQVYQDMTMFAIAEKENIVPDDTKIAEVEADLVAAYGYENVEALRKDVDKTTIEQTAKYEMVLSFVAEKAVEVE